MCCTFPNDLPVDFLLSFFDSTKSDSPLIDAAAGVSCGFSNSDWYLSLLYVTVYCWCCCIEPICFETLERLSLASASNWSS